MSESPELVTLEPMTAAVVRETVPMSELTDFFDRVFGAVMTAAQEQGVAVTGPPFAMYFGMPTDSVDIAAGFPTDRPVSPTADVVPSELPGGRAAQFVHAGNYDDLGQAYGRIASWLGEQNLAPAPHMWETYLNEPTPDGDPADNRTLITWPVAD